MESTVNVCVFGAGDVRASRRRKESERESESARPSSADDRAPTPPAGAANAIFDLARPPEAPPLSTFAASTLSSGHLTHNAFDPLIQQEITTTRKR